MISFKAPYLAELLDENGLLGRVWAQYWRLIDAALDYLGEEQYQKIITGSEFGFFADNTITGLKFDNSHTTQAIVEYFIQVDTLGSTDAILLSGSFAACYSYGTNLWFYQEIYKLGDPARVLVSITGAGQVEMQVDFVDGTITNSRIMYRIRRLAGKTNLYSKVR